MAMKNLGETIDIHCGGEDHIAVHHTNEIAQSEAATGKTFANYWMHIRFLITSSGKMSKSKVVKEENEEKNEKKTAEINQNTEIAKPDFLTVATLPSEYEPLAYRYYCLQTHYRKQLEFTWEGMKAAQNGLEGLRQLAVKAKQQAGNAPVEISPETPCLLKFAGAIADDLNMSAALATVWETLKDNSLPAALRYSFALAADTLLAIDLFKETQAAEQELPEEIKAMVSEREEARKAKDWKKSDELRAALAEKGYTVKDTAKGTEISKL